MFNPFKTSLLGMLNFFLVQWFFFRVYRFWDEDGTENGYGVMGPILPLTGWWGKYVPRTPKFMKDLVEYRHY